MWRSQSTRNPKPGRPAVRLGLCAILAVAPYAAQSAAIGELLAKVEYGHPVLGAEENWLGRLADPHLDFNGDGVHENLGDRSQTAILTSFWTSGAEISTAGDLTRFGISLFEGGLLSSASLIAMRTFQSIDIAGARYEYGLGLFRFDVLGREHWAHSGGLFGSYGWFSYCPSTRVCLAVAYNYPVVKPGANLPGELLIALSTIPTGAPGLATSPREDHGEPGNSIPFRIPFLDPRSSLHGP